MGFSSLPKQIVALALSALLVTGLVIYVIIHLMASDGKVNSITRLSDLLTGYTQLAEHNFTQKKEGKTIDVANDIITPLETEKILLQQIADGTFTHAQFQSGGINFNASKSEDRKEQLKEAIVAIGKLQDQIKTNDEKTATQFPVVSTSVQNIITGYKNEAADKRALLQTLGWISVVLIVLFVITVLVLVNRQLAISRKESSSNKLLIAEESKRVEQLTQFIEAMASGNYNMQIESDAKDELSATLISMRNKLINNAEEEKRRGWASTGIANISGILRDSGNAAELYDKVIKFLVKYTNSNQGGLFILNDDDPQDTYLDLIACYAYERKKFLNKRIGIGQGLVGQCFMEREEIHLTEVPEEYIRITSGLGGEKPQSLLMMPLKTNEKVFGVLELASFQLYPPHVVDLVAKFAENIASTISNIKINESTRILLEQTQQQAEEMKAQEEEMRQNMEELSATQEEMHRKEQEYISRIQELEAQSNLSVKV